MQILLNVTDSKADLLLEFLNSLNYVIKAQKVDTEVEDNSTLKNSNSFFDFDDRVIAMLDKRAQTPNNICLSLEDSILRLSEL